MTRSVMVDIETLGTGNDATIVSIGACFFNPYGGITPGWQPSEGDKFYVEAIYLTQQQRALDPSTIIWWMDQMIQHPEHRRMFVDAPITVDDQSAQYLSRALADLSQWAKKADEVWSHGISFDLIILGNAFVQQGFKPSWHYRDMRDTRTLFELVKQLTGHDTDYYWPSNTEKHNPLADAIAQAKAVMAGVQIIKEMQH